jgi:hypothetical protein
LRTLASGSKFDVHIHWGIALARYIVRATGAAGPIEFQERLTIDRALSKAQELRDAHFTHIAILNLVTGVEIHDLEALLQAQTTAPKP